MVRELGNYKFLISTKIQLTAAVGLTGWITVCLNFFKPLFFRLGSPLERAVGHTDAKQRGCLTLLCSSEHFKIVELLFFAVFDIHVSALDFFADSTQIHSRKTFGRFRYNAPNQKPNLLVVGKE